MQLMLRLVLWDTRVVLAPTMQRHAERPEHHFKRLLAVAHFLVHTRCTMHSACCMVYTVDGTLEQR